MSLSTSSSTDALTSVITWEKRNPATGEVVQTYTNPNEFDLLQCVEQSKAALKTWQATLLSVRSHLFKAIADRIKANALSLAQVVSDETGKPISDSLQTDVMVAMGIFTHYAKTGPKTLAPKPRWCLTTALFVRFHETVYQPYGVAAVISPWNYPLAIAASGIATALMAGNTVILKPSEHTPETGIRLVQIIQEELSRFNLDPNGVQILVGNGNTGRSLINTPIDYCIFTGSSQTGLAIQQTLLPRGIRYSMELGGNCPMILLPSIEDWELVASYTLWGRLVNSGQACAAVKRIYVPVNQHGLFVDHLLRKMAKIKVGPADGHMGNHMGPLISEAQRRKVHQQVQQALQEGATLEFGGVLPEGPGYFYPPTLISNVPPQATFLQEECFGPVLTVIPYDKESDAIEQANNTPYGLSASVFGDPETAHEFANQLSAGMVGINDLPMITYGFPELPWQGWHQSGPGVSHGAEGLLAACQSQLQTTNRGLHWPVFSALWGKPPWFFDQQPSPPQQQALAKSLMGFINSNHWVEILNPALLWGLWQARRSQKL